jgi:hypothetical protein
VNPVPASPRPNVTVGRKLREARQSGFSHIVLFGKQCSDPAGIKVELYDLSQKRTENCEDEYELMSLEEAAAFLKKKSLILW